MSRSETQSNIVPFVIVMVMLAVSAWMGRRKPVEPAPVPPAVGVP